EGNSEHHGLIAKVEAPIGLVAIPDADGFEDAILVDALLNTQELPVLPFPIDQGRGILLGPFHDMLGLALLLGADGAEVDTAKESGHQKLVAFELRNQRAPRGFRISRAATAAGGSTGSERQGLGNLALLFGHGLELAFKIEPSNLPLHWADQAIIHCPRCQELLL